MSSQSPVNVEPVNVEQFVRAASVRLEQAGLYFGHGTETAWDEAAWLIAQVLAVSPQHPLAADQVLTATQLQQAEHLLSARIETRKPLAYLLQSAWFCGHEFFVDERVIVPRSPIAELIAGSFSPWLLEMPQQVLDLCTGSGCIAIACALQFPDARVDATDISDDALAVAAINVRRYKLESRLTLYRADVFDGLPLQRYDLIVANPPYVDAEDMAAMPQEFLHEPGLALASGVDGLDVVRRILCQAGAYLSDNGMLVCEVGNSEAALGATFPQVPFTWLEFDYGGSGVFLLTAEQLKQYQSVFRD